MLPLFIALVAGAIGYFVGMQRGSAVPTPVPDPASPTDPDHGRDPFVEPTFIAIGEARAQRKRFAEFLREYPKDETRIVRVLEDPVTIPDAIPAFTALFKLKGVTALRAYPILKMFDDGNGGKEEKLSLVFTAVGSDGKNMNPQRRGTSPAMYLTPQAAGAGSNEVVENNNHPCKQPCSL